MIDRKRGFTLVELILIIVTLGLLMTIGAFAWGGVAASSRDRTRAQDVKVWISTFDLYKSKYGVYPIIPSNFGSSIPQNEFCLGDFNGAAPYNFGGKCAQYKSATRSLPTANSATANQAMLDEVKKVGSLPVNAGPAIGDTIVGPIVAMDKSQASGTSITLTAKFINFFENTSACPTDFTDVDDNNLNNALIGSLPSGVNTRACMIVKQVTYDPGP